jgi:ATP-dependent Zn protease
MDETLGCVSYDSPHPALLQGGLPDDGHFRPPVSEVTQQAMDRAIHGILGDALARAVQLLRARRPELECCVQALLAHETLDAQALQALLEPPDGAA